MKRVVSAGEMRWCDKRTIRDFGISGLSLMENAGRGVAEAVRKEFPSLESKVVLIVCGKGNNGGDGFVAARLLSNYGASVYVFLTFPPAQLKGEAKKNYFALIKYSGRSGKEIVIKKYSRKTRANIPRPDVVIDAVFGTGFSGSIKGNLIGLFEWINRSPAKVLAVDIPSGVNGTTGTVENCAVRADETVTFGFLKSGLLCNRGRELAGRVQVIDIGIPAPVGSDRSLKTNLVEISDLNRILPVRPVHSHKYSVGKVYVLAGSKGLTGAAAMCCSAAMRAGAGAVILGTPESVYPILARKLTEVMVDPLPETAEGTLGGNSMGPIGRRIEWADVVVLGPGLSRNQETRKLLIDLIKKMRKRTLVDADGLNAVADFGIDRMNLKNSHFILTPHAGEFARLTGTKVADVERQRIYGPLNLAKQIGCTVILKGVPTITAVKDGSVFINSSGNPGMATAGSGDVLSGIIAGLWAQGMSEKEAAWGGVLLHGLSGDIGVGKMGERSLMATDIIKYLPEAFKMIETGLV